MTLPPILRQIPPIPLSVKRNFFKALDRLVCAAIDIPVGALERRSAEKWAETEARNKIMGGITGQTVGQMEVDREYAQRAFKKYGEKILREQGNLDKIFAFATNFLKKETLVDASDQAVDTSDDNTIHDDFLNTFHKEGSQKSSEEMQLLFARILAGEIQQPGSYSIKAVKILGELDQNIATLFRKLCSACVAIVVDNKTNGHIVDARVCTLGGRAGTNVLSKYGLSFDQLNLLNEYGLVISNYDPGFPYLVSGTGIPFRHQGRTWVLLPTKEHTKSKELRVSGVALSRVGRELFPIVDQDPMENYTQELKRFFAEQNLQMIEVPSQNKT